MRFKLDENLPVELAAELRAMGHDADTVADEGLCGEADPVVVEAASNAGRILLTLDKGSLMCAANCVRVRFYSAPIPPAVEPSFASFATGFVESQRWNSRVE